ncbi:MAG: c-type cytochrome [Acidobacteriota bacterium]
MIGKGMLLLPLAILVSLGLQVDVRAQSRATELSVPEGKAAKAGKKLYRRKCVFCHGTKGRGDGQVSRYVFPKPRDLALGLFKIRSTPTGGLPTDQDLFDTLTRGVPGTTMPSWSNLNEAERWELVAYIKTFSDKFREEERLEPITIRTPTAPYPESVANGRRLYLEAECWTCHGMLGKGDGPSSATLTDDWGYPIVPADLRVSRNWRGGNRPQDIFRSISVGIGGTPMPSWGDALTEDQIWDLTNYLLSIIQQ